MLLFLNIKLNYFVPVIQNKGFKAEGGKKKKDVARRYYL